MKSLYQGIGFVFCGVLFSIPAYGDLVPKNKKEVDGEVIIENVSKYDFRFYLYPVGASFNEIQALNTDYDGMIRTKFYAN